MATKELTLDDRKKNAIAAVDMNNPLAAYIQHLDGFQNEYGYGEFLGDCGHADAPPQFVKKKPKPVTKTETQKTVEPESAK